MTIFLDRDGVINQRIIGDYVRNVSQWKWLPNAVEAIVRLSHQAEHIFVVTNQQGVGKGYFSMENLSEIMDFMAKSVAEKGGNITDFFCCPHLESDNCGCRKPQIGMALQAKNKFPNIDFSQAIMVGDSFSDMEFGRNAGMETVFICTDKVPQAHHLHLIDEMYDSLWDFALHFETV